MEAQARGAPGPLKARRPQGRGTQGPAARPRRAWGPGRSPGFRRTSNSAPVHQSVATYRVRNPSDSPNGPAASAVACGSSEDGVPGGHRGPPAGVLNAWGGTEGRPRPPQPRLRAEGAFGEARPIPALRPEARPMHDLLLQEQPTPGTAWAYGKPALLLSAVLPGLPRWRLTF